MFLNNVEFRLARGKAGVEAEVSPTQILTFNGASSRCKTSRRLNAVQDDCEKQHCWETRSLEHDWNTCVENSLKDRIDFGID